MLIGACKFWFLLILSGGCWLIFAHQTVSDGSLEVSGRIRIEKKSIKLQRKRFYLLPGGLAENKALIDKLRSTEIVSRDCYYKKMQASPEFICWLKAEDCESPYCRAISETDIDRVPEFTTAFQKGLRQFGRNRTDLARNWLTTNLDPKLRDGFYQGQKVLLRDLLKEARPLQSAMTDSVTVKAIFIDIPLKSADGAPPDKETFLVSNILPFEIGDKSYVWACEVEIGADKMEKLILKVPDDDKPVKGCEVIVKDLPVCNSEDCQK